mmetsp:Transcript_105444/g.308284  ORF Transcript_105444/g.308284 Transcript_105444/m.308284 type:complete len:386 (+) Transcript_105444:46-1203(+)
MGDPGQTTDQDSELWKSLENKDLYKVLGVSTDASSKDIERAFRRKARDVHPDKHSDPLSTERFKELSTAKDLLLDAGKRWWYDQRRQHEADVVARVLEEARLRAKAKEEEQSREFATDEEKLAQFVAKAQAEARRRAEAEGHSSDEDDTDKSGQLRASAPEFVPSARGRFSDQVVEVYSLSAQRWCPGLVLGVDELPGGRAALTVRYQVSEVQWNEKMLYDNDPNLRTIAGTVGKGELRADAPAFVPTGLAPTSASPCPETKPVTVPLVPCIPSAAVQQMQVTVPPGAFGGQQINIITSAGKPLTVQVPPGLRPGQTFLCSELPAATPCVFPPPLAPRQQMQVTVPVGASGGQQISIITSAGLPMVVQVPPGLCAGQTFLCAAAP